MGCEAVADHQILTAELLLVIKELIFLSVQWTGAGSQPLKTQCSPSLSTSCYRFPSSCRWACPSWVPVRSSYLNLGLKDSPESSRFSPVLIHPPATAELFPLAGLGLSFKTTLSLLIAYLPEISSSFLLWSFLFLLARLLAFLFKLCFPNNFYFCIILVMSFKDMVSKVF